MALIALQDVCWGFGGPPLLDNINLQIEKGQRICLLGRNGVGKSTLLRLISGDISPDSGSIPNHGKITISALGQEVPMGADLTIFEVVARGLRDTEFQNSEYVNSGSGPTRLKQSVESILSRAGLDPELRFVELSAGMKRRTLFAQALVADPDLLLLDEPTNHLDIAAITWMEEYIKRHVKTLLFVTHDRAFLKRIANRIIELDRGGITVYDCGYDTFLQRRDATMEAEAHQDHVFDKKLSREEIWIRQGIKARRTRNEGRVRALLKMREKARDRRKKIGNVRLVLQEAKQSGKMVIEATAVDHCYGQTPVLSDFSTTVMRGDKVGIIGPNGVGKTTLLNILLKKISPDSGTVCHGTHLDVAYFDQLRDQLDEEKTLVENIGEGNDFIVFNGGKRHVISHLQDFLFSPDRCRIPIRVLSGGERNRLLLAKLFIRPANVLVLDEPTNDLDVETLELLEELLFNYKGTLLLVSHDRAFLNSVVTSTLVFEGKGRVTEYAGGYDDWLLQRPKPVEPEAALEKETPKAHPPPIPSKPRKLGYMQSRELQALPGKIDALESEQKELYAVMSDPSFYKKNKDEITAIQKSLQEVEGKIKESYIRWEFLESLE
jgi:ABC transport system ATP-binding/permease protein